MELSPEERRRIYEEEKARIEAEGRDTESGDTLSSNIPQNVACMLCYALFWISGIIFLVLEKKDKEVNFHAIQSIVLFGGLTVLSLFFNWIPYVGSILNAIIGISMFILWIVLMVKTYQGERFKVPVAGDIAEAIHKSVWKTPDSGETENKEGQDFAENISQKVDDLGKKADNYFHRTRGDRIIGYSFAIFWAVVFIVFFAGFSEYIAWYFVGDDGKLIMEPFLTPDFQLWLPVLITALSVTIVANIILIVYDRYWFREAVQIVLELIGIAVVIYLVVIFPFDFSIIPDAIAAGIIPVVAKSTLIVVAIALGVSALVRFIKMIFNIDKAEYLN
ncbi:MAG: hypothetical protein WC958_03590 [Dehalococcoidales bacterium]